MIIDHFLYKSCCSICMLLETLEERKYIYKQFFHGFFNDCQSYEQFNKYKNDDKE